MHWLGVEISMIDYLTLKHSDDGMPTWDAYLGPVLQTVGSKNLWRRRELVTAVIEYVNLPNNLKERRYTSNGGGLIAENRVSFAISDLKIAKLIVTPKRGMYRITPEGTKFFQEYGNNVTRSLVHSTSGYISYYQAKDSKEDVEANASRENASLEQVKAYFSNQLENVQDNLLHNLTKMNPYLFEELMVRLLNKMGYQGNNGQSLITKKSNDGGIDGVINQDPLGLQKVYVQVKRYGINNSVGSQEIQGFSGSLQMKHADHGVFITTSSYTKKALEAAKALNIVVIDGDRLTGLMIQYGIGVEINRQYSTYKIDLDIFE